MALNLRTMFERDVGGVVFKKTTVAGTFVAVPGPDLTVPIPAQSPDFLRLPEQSPDFLHKVPTSCAKSRVEKLGPELGDSTYLNVQV